MKVSYYKNQYLFTLPNNRASIGLHRQKSSIHLLQGEKFNCMFSSPVEEEPIWGLFNQDLDTWKYLEASLLSIHFNTDFRNFQVLGVTSLTEKKGFFPLIFSLVALFIHLTLIIIIKPVWKSQYNNFSVRISISWQTSSSSLGSMILSVSHPASLKWKSSKHKERMFTCIRTSTAVSQNLSYS